MSTYQRDLSVHQIEEIGRKLAEDRLPAVEQVQAEVEFKPGPYFRFVKRPLDVVASAVGLVVTLPINAVIGAATFFDLGRPLFFKQERVGKDARKFKIVKFRNMRNDVDANGDLLPPDMRVTKWGKFVRKTSLDELLNFWSIFKGDMSLIGPRPLPTIYMERYSKRHMARFKVRPGLECPPKEHDQQLRTWNDQLENDVWYVENVSFKTDCKMLINLVRFVFDRKNAQARAVAERGSFMGYDFDGRAINDAEIPQEYLDWVKSLPVPEADATEN